MIIVKNKFCFIHIPKTSGSSLTSILTPYIAKEHRKLKTRKEDSGPGWQGTWHIGHQHAFLNQYNVSKINGLDVITIVRNPYSRMISFYNNFNTGQFSSFKDFLLDKGPQLGFSNTLHQLPIVKNQFNIKIKWYKQESDAHINICKDYDLKYIKKEIVVGQGNGMKTENLLNYNRNDYTEYYDDETREIVAEKYAKDIEYFGYEFGE
jgi:hypothetical protein